MAAMNPDLAIERKNAPFNFRTVSSFLYGGDEVLARRKFIGDYVDRTPELNDSRSIYFMNPEQRYENSIRKTVEMLKHAKNLNLKNYEEELYYHCLILPRERQLTPATMQYIMFLPSIEGQCTEEQKKKWLPLTKSNNVIGTYAQTELGHGSNLRKLETTAIYDAAAEEFVVHSPTLTSTKWWPGNLGKTANYAVVLAQLHTKGKNYGIHAFMVQLRDLKTHQPLPGVTVGDIGPKFGFHTNDNGFLRFDQVRIPRDNMLMRFSKVDPDGTYRPPKHQKLVYGAMIYIRASMITNQTLGLASAATIATRYSCVRRQGEKVDGAGEVKLLDYQTQQYRIFPEIAKAYAFYFAGMYLERFHKKISTQVLQGDVELLPELHIVSSGLKAYVTFEVARGIEQCRLSCGGHGYSQASGLPELYTNMVGACTYEGDNIIMFLQVARHLVKTVKTKKNERLSSYLWKKVNAVSLIDRDVKLGDLLDVYEHAAQRKILETVRYLDELEKQGMRKEDAWDRCSVELTKCSKAHVRVFLVKNFIEYVETATDPNVKKLMHMLCQFYVLYGIHVKPGTFVQDGYVTAQQLGYIRHRVYEILAEIRKIAVPLVDAFDFRDRELNSILGRYDGDVYPNLLKWASESPLNKQEVLDCQYKYVTPVQSKL